MSNGRRRHATIFLSTVSDEFKVYRDALRPLLKRPNVDVHVQEDFIATGGLLIEKLDDDYVKNSDMVIHFVGDMTGAWANAPTLAALNARYPDFCAGLPALQPLLQAGNPPLSYTQIEAYLALHHGIPLVIVVPEPGAQRGPNYVVAAAQQQSQQTHLARLRTLGRYPEIKFGNPDQLAAHVMRSSVVDLLVEVAGEAARNAETRNRPINLPYPSLGALFKGRDQFMAGLRESFTRPGDPASAITNVVHGLGGVGKTRVAVEYARQHAGAYSALLFVAADTTEDLRGNLAALAGPMMLNLPEQRLPEEDIKRGAVLRWLRQHPGWLLILDNVDTEKLAAEVEEMIAGFPGGHVLITSRLSRWSGAIDRLELDVIDEDAAVTFLLERTERRRRKADDDEAQVRMVVTELGGLALALEQAGAYIDRRRLSFAQYLAEWHANRDGVAKWLDERQMKYPRSLAVTWQTSMDQLNDPAQRLLQRLAFLGPEPIPDSLLDVPAPGETGVDQRELLADLETYSLVTRLDGAFTVHRLVQDVTRRSLAGRPAQIALLHALWWVAQAFHRSVTDIHNWRLLGSLAPHARAVAGQANMDEMLEPAGYLWGRLGDLLHPRVPLSEVETLFQSSLAATERKAQLDPDNPGWQRESSISSERLGDIYFAQGKLAAAMERYRASLDRMMAIRNRDPSNAYLQRFTSVTLSKVGDVLVAQGNLPEALKSFRAGLAIAETLVNEFGERGFRLRDLSVFHERIGNVLLEQDNLAEASESFGVNLAIADRLSKEEPNNMERNRDLAVALSNSGAVHLAQENLPGALKSFQDSLAIRTLLVNADPGNADWQSELSLSYRKIGDVLAMQGDLAEALKSIQASLDITKRLAKADPENTGWQRDLLVSLNNVGTVWARQGNRLDALKSFRESLAIVERLVALDPENVEWQIDLVAANDNLAGLGDAPALRWTFVVERLRLLQREDRLPVEQEQWLLNAERRLAALDGWSQAERP